MPTFVTGPVEVSVPATCANLGPGYDSLGLALDFRDLVTAEVTGRSGAVIEVRGEGRGEVPRREPPRAPGHATRVRRDGL